MADPPAYSETNDDTGVPPGRRPTPGTPRWVKVSGIIALVLVLVFLVLLLTGNHGPGRHSSGVVGGHAPPLSVTERVERV